MKIMSFNDRIKLIEGMSYLNDLWLPKETATKRLAWQIVWAPMNELDSIFAAFNIGYGLDEILREEAGLPPVSYQEE
jgi:hypothetical protein